MATVQLNGSLKAKSHERLSDPQAATGFTAAKYNFNPSSEVPATQVLHAEELVVTVEANDIRWTCDGTTPTTTATTALGHLASAGDCVTIQGYDNIRNFKIINAVTASAAKANGTFFFRQ